MATPAIPTALADAAKSVIAKTYARGLKRKLEREAEMASRTESELKALYAPTLLIEESVLKICTDFVAAYDAKEPLPNCGVTVTVPSEQILNSELLIDGTCLKPSIEARIRNTMCKLGFECGMIESKNNIYVHNDLNVSYTFIGLSAHLSLRETA